jgi:hypothetical protein
MNSDESRAGREPVASRLPALPRFVPVVIEKWHQVFPGPALARALGPTLERQSGFVRVTTPAPGRSCESDGRRWRE